MNDASLDSQGEAAKRGLSYAERRQPDWPRQFLPTKSTLVRAAGHGDSAALEELCCRYWFPLYAYVRRWGRSPEDAADITQEFIARFLVRGGPKAYAAAQGKFRSYLLGALKHYLSELHARETRKKRGSGQKPISFDGMSAEERLKSEPPDPDDPAKAFDRRCVMADLDYALHNLEAEYDGRGEIRIFECLKPLLLKEITRSHKKVAADLGMAEGTFTVALHRLKKRLGEAIIADLTRRGVPKNKIKEALAEMLSLVSA